MINYLNEAKSELNIKKNIDCKIFSNIFDSLKWLTNDEKDDKMEQRH